VNAITEDAALAAGCRAGNLHAYERLFSLHGARMKNLARNLLGNPGMPKMRCRETFLKVQRSIASFRGQSSFYHLDLPNSDSTPATTRAAAVCARKKFPTTTRRKRRGQKPRPRVRIHRCAWRWSARLGVSD